MVVFECNIIIYSLNSQYLLSVWQLFLMSTVSDAQIPKIVNSIDIRISYQGKICLKANKISGIENSFLPGCPYSNES